MIFPEIQETTATLNAGDYIEENEPMKRQEEVEASLDLLTTINPRISEYQEEIPEESIEEPLDIEFDNENLPRR